MQFGLLSSQGHRRDDFTLALTQRGHPPPHFINYQDILNHPDNFLNILNEIDILRIDTPGGDYPVWRAFSDFFGLYQDQFTPEEHGRIYPQDPFIRGVNHSVSFAAQHAKRTSTPCTIDPNAIKIFMDKSSTHQLCQTKGLPVPDGFYNISSFETLNTLMIEKRLRRVFVKLRHGSSASGVIAFEKHGHCLRARTSIEMVEDGPHLRLFNSLKIHSYLDEKAITLIDALAPMGVHVENWIPKFKLRGQPCDLRLLVIDQQPAHCVIRSSTSPITNLHLGNSRHKAQDLRSHLPPSTWENILHIGTQAGALFPDQFCIGVDIAVHENKQDIYILEINAFGDQLHHVTHEGLSPYAYQIQCLERKYA